MADFYWRIEFLSAPTIGNSDVWSYTRSPAPHLRQHVIVAHVSNKHFKTVLVFFVPVVILLRFSCLLCCCRSFTPATVSPFRRELLFVFVYLLRKFDRFWCLKYHRSPCFVFSVLLSSFTPATVSLLIFVNYENSTGFDIIWNTVRFVSCLLCCCRVSLQPQFAILPTG